MLRTERFNRIMKLVLLILLIIALAASIYLLTVPNRNMPLAKQGVLDLSDWDFSQRGTVMLDGEWEFYEGQLLEPADFRQGSEEAEISYLYVPGTWKGKAADGGMKRKGFGTYRLKVLLQDEDEVLGLKIKSIRMAQRLFINGKKEGESGQPSAYASSGSSGNTPYTVFFHSKDKEVELLIQVSNYVYVTGGIVNSIPFGAQADITRFNGIQLGSDFGIICILGMFGAYHLCLYFLGRRKKAYLLSGLYLLLLSLDGSLYGEKISLLLLPNVPFDAAYKLLEISQFLSAIVIILFFCSVESRLMTVRSMKLLLAPFIVYLLGVVVLPYRYHISVKYLFFGYLAVLVMWMIARMMYLYIQSKESSFEERELMLFIGGAISLMIFLVDASLYSENLVPTDWAGKCGVIGFIVFINLLLALRFSNAHEKAEILSRKLMVSNQLKDEFLMNTSHEIKTPLHGIMNMTSFLLENEEQNLLPRQKQNLWLIKDTSTKLSMLIQDLIDVSLLKHGELRLHSTVVDVRVAVQIVLDMLQFELVGKSVRLENAIKPDIWVMADESRLRQVLYNLVYNAIKHTDNGWIKILSGMAGNMVTITVEDTGIGIAPNKFSAIFEYFEQLEEPLPMDGYTGMGVGLYISRKLVERMGGEIRVDWSETGEGTRMLFSLPKVEEISGYTEAAASMEEKMLQRLEHLDGQLDILGQHEHTILIVDDEASNIHSLLSILRNHPYNVITSFSAKEALDKMKEYPRVDLVILDVMMPGISGIELCRTLRGGYSILDLPILFATVKDTPPDIALGFQAGANDYITKPFDGETLLARIQTLIAMKTSIQEAIQNELAFHQAQIKPHFLYNALSSVISFCYTDGEKAAHLLSMLSQYIRYILDTDRAHLVVPLTRELDLIHAYVEIEKARFGDRFTFICDVDESLQYVEIPSLCIQPFVENAIRHGLFEKDGEGIVALKIQKGQGFMQVHVEDDGIGIPEHLLYQMVRGEYQNGGIGISNIRKRLDAIPGAAFTIHSEAGQGTKVTMYLPLDSSGNGLGKVR
ncbi:signal transduction histidine kinase [Paenibacillus castaneae]|uniref:ATP-binding protein n=1 Tax=Paenibacillus castaneae TaxID=474957 RepID=UPI000C9B96D2|nr:ATP-binding protein [Paenibacillus castaneae]NIK78522.1 signal transduction histidine kinase [Paenibacillus castaneae]